MFEDAEISLGGVVLGLLGGILSVVVMSKVEVNIIFKILSFILTTIVCYFVAGKIVGD